MDQFALQLQIGFFFLSVVLGYLFWVRPYLKTRPGCIHFYERTDSIWSAIRLRFQGIKGQIATGLAKGAAVVLMLHDQLIPYVTGVDWTPITQNVPPMAWPIITFAAFWFIGKCREWAESRA